MARSACGTYSKFGVNTAVLWCLLLRFLLYIVSSVPPGHLLIISIMRFSPFELFEDNGIEG
jgi:hypothetical protein